MSSKRILIVEKTGVIKESLIKSFNVDELYKKAGFKSPEEFELAHQWTLSDGTTVSLYGKSSGRAGQENKYDFPPPVDKILFFGSCILISDKASLKKSEWETYYEELFGGFEDIGDADSEVASETDEDDEDAGLPRTKSGYAKDGFVVDDNTDSETDIESVDEEDEVEDDVEEVVVVPKKQKRNEVKRKGKISVFEKIETSNDENLFLDCTSELNEEEYEE